MVSIIVPVYNVKEYLERCIDSLMEQDYDDYEILLIDDGSTDGSPEMCDEYESKYEKVHTFHKENGGLSSARNFGVEKAKGEFVTFVDSDDFVDKRYLSDLVKLKNKFNADMAITRVVLQSLEEASMPYTNHFEDFVLDNKEAFFEVYVNNKVGWSGCGKLFPKKLIQEIPFPTGYYEEMASAYLFINACEKIAIGDYGNNYHYIRREGSITDCSLSEKHLRIFEVCKELENFIMSNYPTEKYAVVLLYQNSVLQLLTKIKMDDESYKEIFKKFRKMFRKNLLLMLKSKMVVKKSKYYSIMLCTTPLVFKLQRKLFQLISKRKA